MTIYDAENEDVLRRLRASGDDLSRPRNVDFSVVFPSESSAEQFARSVRSLGYEVSVRLSNVVEQLPWDATVVKHMTPSNSEITGFEAMLGEIAARFSGRNDGWGCFSEESAAPTEPTI